jgi:cell division protease FtsH
MAKELLESEVIEGKTVRNIIEAYEKENSMESRLAHKEKVAKAEQHAKEHADAADARAAQQQSEAQEGENPEA